MKSAILFDLDGTLIDSTEAILEGFAYALGRFGHDSVPKEEILSLVGHPLDYMFLRLGVKGDVQEYVKAYKERYRQIFKQKTKLLPHAKEAIEEARCFAKLAVVTTKTGSYSRQLLEHLGLLDAFALVIGKEDVINPKPHPEPLLKAMHKMRAHPDRTWMVGDTCLDMDGAKRAGIKGIGVLCGYGSARRLAECAHYLAPDPLAAVRKIERIETSIDNLK